MKPCLYVLVLLILLRYHVSCSLTTQEIVADRIEKAKELRKNARICDYPECRVKKQDANKMRKCGGCREARYCCDEHQKLHWPLHSSLCKELRA